MYKCFLLPTVIQLLLLKANKILVKKTILKEKKDYKLLLFQQEGIMQKNIMRVHIHKRQNVVFIELTTCATFALFLIKQLQRRSWIS